MCMYHVTVFVLLLDIVLASMDYDDGDDDIFFGDILTT
jgi:hypothetical protein